MLLEKLRIRTETLIILIIQDLRMPHEIQPYRFLGKPFLKVAHIPHRKTKH